jgi:hypothetical protein
LAGCRAPCSRHLHAGEIPEREGPRLGLFLGYGRVALAVTIAVAVVGLGTSELDPAIATTRVAGLPADPAEISQLPVFSPAISQQVIGLIRRAL